MLFLGALPAIRSTRAPANWQAIFFAGVRHKSISRHTSGANWPSNQARAAWKPFFCLGELYIQTNLFYLAKVLSTIF